MTQPTFSISLIRELRGSPLTVLVAILLLEQSGQLPVTAQLLKDTTGYRDHTITDSLRVLASPTRQLVTRTTGGWRLASGFQLPLEIQNRDIRENVLSSSCSSSNRKSNKLLQEPEQETIENRDIRGFAANHAAALQAGIRDPKASELSALPHVTPEYIQAHVAQAQEDGHPLGTAIYRIIHNWSVQVDESKLRERSIIQSVSKLTGHKPGCKCMDCSMARLGMPLCPNCRRIYQNCECESQIDDSTSTR